MSYTREELMSWVCTLMWSSVAGWHNRPDYFDTNDLTLISDLAYLAQCFPEKLAGVMPEKKLWASDIVDLTVDGFQWHGERWERLIDLLEGKTDTTPPLQCNAKKYRDALRTTDEATHASAIADPFAGGNE